MPPCSLLPLPPHLLSISPLRSPPLPNSRAARGGAGATQRKGSLQCPAEKAPVCPSWRRKRHSSLRVCLRPLLEHSFLSFSTHQSTCGVLYSSWSVNALQRAQPRSQPWNPVPSSRRAQPPPGPCLSRQPLPRRIGRKPVSILPPFEQKSVLTKTRFLHVTQGQPPGLGREFPGAPRPSPSQTGPGEPQQNLRNVLPRSCPVRGQCRAGPFVVSLGQI